MTQHTPGPWMIEQQDSSFRNAVVSTGTDAPWNPLIAEVAVDADARLIAAAPEMLALLQHCVGHLPPGSITQANVEALIARVEGKS